MSEAVSEERQETYSAFCASLDEKYGDGLPPSEDLDSLIERSESTDSTGEEEMRFERDWDCRLHCAQVLRDEDLDAYNDYVGKPISDEDLSCAEMHVWMACSLSGLPEGEAGLTITIFRNIAERLRCVLNMQNEERS